MKIIADTNIPFVEECFSSIGNVEVISGRQMTADIVRDADCLLVRSITRVDSKLLEGSNIRFVGTATIGTDHIDTEYLSKNNIGFASAPGSNANSVAEYITAALLVIAKRHNLVLEGKSIGIIGVGNVGSNVVKKTQNLEMNVYLNDPPMQRQTGNTKFLSLEKLFECDFITIHTPLTFDGIDKTYHLCDEKFFNSLKKGCIFLNTARGSVVKTDALKTALRISKIKAAVLDVWENEPNIDTELLEMSDLATPHIAGYSFDGKVEGMIMIYNSVCKYFGFKSEFNAKSFLPEPATSQLKINPENATEQQVLAEAVEKIYDINKDDQRLRHILKAPLKEKPIIFDKLRKEYPVRREFQNTQIVLEPWRKNIAEKFVTLGFEVPDG